MIIGILFLIVAREVRAPAIEQRSRPLGPKLRRRVSAVSVVLGCRDFAGLASLSIASIYLQKAHGYDAKRTGFIVGSMMLGLDAALLSERRQQPAESERARAVA